MHKAKGVGLFDLVKDKDGGYRCYACTLCERTCPVDCIEIDFCPEFEELPFDVDAERAARARPCPARGRHASSSTRSSPRIREGSGLIEAFHTTQETLRLPAAQGARGHRRRDGPAASRASSAWRASTASSAWSRSASTSSASAWARRATSPAPRWSPRPSPRSSTSRRRHHARPALHAADRQLHRRLRARARRPPRRRRDLRPRSRRRRPASWYVKIRKREA